MSLDERERQQTVGETTPLLARTGVPNLWTRLGDVISSTYDLGFTAFGGPPVHFQIFHRRFVDGIGSAPWIDERTYQELFGICQALPGPGSTKMLFNIVLIHAGILPALLAFFLWSMPGAIAMYTFSALIQRLDEVLPAFYYALLSGLNAAIVGVIALAAVHLSRNAATDKLTRILIVFGACAGLSYNALWYYPTLILMGGLATLVWDSYLAAKPEEREQDARIEPDPQVVDSAHLGMSAHIVPVKLGLFIIAFFLMVLIAFMILRGILPAAPLLLSLFNNMFLAGTIIFGGGPVVIPLLREYVVVPGWVSPRDFLIGLAIIQALPGPNFNFAVYLGALTVAGSDKSIPSVVGALLAFVGIFTPGLSLSVGFQSLWGILRKHQSVISLLRGFNATAVGFVFTAVYSLWQIGYLTPEDMRGISLGQEPRWVVISAVSYTMVEWFGIPPAGAILFGGAAGLGFWIAR